MLSLFVYFEYYFQAFLKWVEKASEVYRLPVIIILSELNVIAQYIMTRNASDLRLLSEGPKSMAKAQ